MPWLRVILLALVSLTAIATSTKHAHAEDTIFSGPQVGEALPPFSFRGTLGEFAGKDLDLLKQAAGKPVVLIFVHDINRQSISFARVLAQYAHGRRESGLTSGVIFLNADATETENAIKRMQHALAPGVPTGVSLEGVEGPGSYGLNRRVMLTILVGKEDKVTANFALIQPSLQVDLPKVLASVVEVAGGEVPKLEELEGMPEMMRVGPNSSGLNSTGNEAPPNLRPLLAPLIRKSASQEDVERAAKAVEEAIQKDAAARKEIGRIASTIVNAGKLKDYGNEHAQKFLAKWAKEIGAPSDKTAPDRNETKQPGAKE